MELVFVHESGYPDPDGASETSEESNDGYEDEGGWGHVEFSGSDARKCSTLQGCAIPIDGDQPSLEKVSFHPAVGYHDRQSCFCRFWTCHTLLK